MHEFLIASVHAFRNISPHFDELHLAILKHQLMDPCSSRDVLDLEFSPTGEQEGYFVQLDEAVAHYLSCARNILKQRVRRA